MVTLCRELAREPDGVLADRAKIGGQPVAEQDEAARDGRGRDGDGNQIRPLASSSLRSMMYW